MNLLIRPFYIEISVGGKPYSMRVEQTYLTKQIEHFQIEGNVRTIIIQTDRPLFRNKGLNSRKYKCQAFPGSSIHNQSALEMTIDEIRRHIKNVETPPPNLKK